MKFPFVILLVVLTTGHSQPLFTLVTPQKSGILFQNNIKESATQNVLNYEYFYNGGGVAVGDLINDHLPDIVFTANLDQPKVYLNKGNFVFEDVTGKSKIRADGWKTGVTMADVNADGWLDVYICRSGNGDANSRRNLLWINQKNGSFKEMAADFNINEKGYCTQAAFFDFGQKHEIDLTAQSLQCLTDLMIHDIISPLVASRNYAYSMIAFYETCRYSDTSYKSLAGQVNGLQQLPAPRPRLTYDWLVAGAQAFYKTSYALVFSKAIFQLAWDSVCIQLKKRTLDTGMYNRSVRFGNLVAEDILRWAGEDNYLHTRTLLRFTTSTQQGYWQQTPPDYMEAIEPYWNQIRPMTLAAAN